MAAGSEDTKVLVIEDDDSIAGAVEIVVRKLGYRATRAADGREGMRTFFDQGADLVVLDVGLPLLDGWQVLERIRDVSEVPVLMLTAMDLEQDKVRGLLGGADDYLTKPFGIRELGARIEALLRRAKLSSSDTDAGSEERFQDGNLTVEWAAREVLVDGQPVPLTALEFRLLEAFVRHPGQALSTEQLLELAWDDPFAIAPDRVKFAVLRLRRKLGWGEGGPDPLEAVRGYGYRFRPMG